MADPRSRVIISGCSGGGKSALIDELARRGHQVMQEAGREIVQEQLAKGGKALPWENEAKFVEHLLERSLVKFLEAPSGLSFYDRSLVEPLRWYRETGAPIPAHLSETAKLRYADEVFLVPPWPQIHVQDNERRHDFATAIQEYEALANLFPHLGYTVHLLPKVSVAERADFVETVLGLR